VDVLKFTQGPFCSARQLGIVIMIKGKDAKMYDSRRNVTIDVNQGLPRNATGGGIIHVDALIRLDDGVNRSGVLGGQVNTKGHPSEMIGQMVSDHVLIGRGRGEFDALLNAINGKFNRISHLPFDFTVIKA